MGADPNVAVAAPQEAQEKGAEKAARPIYLDNAATTPVDPRVVERMVDCLGPAGAYGNAASRSHSFGWDAERLVEDARAHVADLIGADPREIVFTSGATESDNLAIKGAAHFYADSVGRHIVTSRLEHKAVLDSCRQLEEEGFEVTWLEPGSDGIIEPQAVAAAIRPDTCLVTLMHANNEIGTLTDIAAIGALCAEKGVLFHTDAAQSAGKVAVDVRGGQVALLSLSAHKMYGPKGIGALYVRRRPRVRLRPLIQGGGHERGMRSGTLPTHQIVGFGEACRIAAREMEAESTRTQALRRRLWDALKDMEQVYLNGDHSRRLPGLLNISFAFVEGESLIMALKDIAVSSGSACTSASLEPSYVLRALGLDDELAHSSLRITIGRFTTQEEVDRAARMIRDAVSRLRDLSPLWDMYKDGVDLKTVEWTGH